MKSFLKTLALPVAVLGCALMLAPPAGAEANPEDRKLCSEATEDPKSLLTCLKSLNERVSAIEDEPEEAEEADDTDEKITALEDQIRQAKAEIASLKSQVEAAGGGAGGVAGTGTITAPFTVVDGAGATIFAVTGDSSDVKVVVGSSEGNGITLASAGDLSAIALASGERTINLNAGAGLNAITVNDPAQGKVGLGQIGDGFSGVIAKGGDGGDIFKLGTSPARVRRCGCSTAATRSSPSAMKVASRSWRSAARAAKK